MNAKLEAALEYAARGMYVFPCKENNKSPMTDSGHNDATIDPNKIRQWWSNAPNANIGLFLARSGLVAIDVDAYKSECEWGAFVKGIDIPDTLEQRTPRNGIHLIFRDTPSARYLGKLCEGVDIKHQGYILLEPSEIDGNTYQMLNDNEPAMAPAWVPQRRSLIAKEYIRNTDRIASVLKGNNWHNNVLELVGSYVHKGLSDEEIQAFAGGFTLPSYTVDQTKSEIQRMIDGARAKGFGPKPTAELNYIDVDSLWDKEIPPVNWVVKPYLPAGLAMVAGQPKVGKSWFALWLAREAVSRNKGVLYLGFEDSERRLQDRIKHVFKYKPRSGFLDFFAGLNSESVFPRGKAALDEFKKKKEACPHLQLIIIDTWEGVRVPCQKDRNYEQSVQELKPLRQWAHDNNIAIVIVHHARKTTEFQSSPLESILGSQGISATIETALVITQKTGSKNILVYQTGKDVEQTETEFECMEPSFELRGHAIETTLGSTQKKCLDCIRDNPNITKSGVSNILEKSLQETGKAINKLIEKGLVKAESIGNTEKLTYTGGVYPVY